MKSLGLVEVPSVTAAIDVLDIMCKTADVHFVTWEKKLGGRLVTVVVQGEEEVRLRLFRQTHPVV